MNYRLKELLLLFVILLLTVFIRIPALTQPLGPDQGIMSALGQGLLHGEIPYKDNWEMASPAIFFTYALIYKAFGLSMSAVPIADLLAALLGTFLLFVLGKRLYGSSIGLLSAFLFTIFTSGVSIGMNAAGELTFGTYWYIAQRESFMSPLIIVGMLLTLKGIDDRRLCWFWLNGILGGILFQYKYPALLFFIMQLMFLNDFRDLRSSASRSYFLKSNGLAVFGFILTLIPTVLFFWAQDALSEMINATFVYVHSIYGNMEMSYTGLIKNGVLHTLTVARESFILWMFTLASSIYILANEREKKNVFMVTWAFTSLIYIIVHREFFGYHYLLIFPPFSILTAYGLTKVLKKKTAIGLPAWQDTRVIIVICVMFSNFVVFTALNYKHYTRFIRYYSGQKSAAWYYGHFTAYPKHEYSFRADYLVSQYIKDKAHPHDRVFVLGGIESVIHILTDLKSPSRFVYSWFLFSTDRSHTEIAERYRRELLDDLIRNSPRFIVSVGPLQHYEEYHAIHNFVASKYQLIQSFPDDRYLFILKT